MSHPKDTAQMTGKLWRPAVASHQPVVMRCRSSSVASRRCGPRITADSCTPV